MENSVYDGDLRNAPTPSMIGNDYISVAVVQSPRRAQFWQSSVNLRDRDQLRTSGLGSCRPLSKYGISG